MASILEQLDLNQSFFFQFVVFTIAYLALSKLVFTPYAKALEERENRTTGGQDLAEEIHKKAEELRTQYETKARQVNGSVKTIFDEYRQDASKEYENIVSKARIESHELIEAARKKVSVEIGEAQARMKNEIPAVAQEITRRVLAK